MEIKIQILYKVEVNNVKIQKASRLARACLKGIYKNEPQSFDLHVLTLLSSVKKVAKGTETGAERSYSNLMTLWS